jgi:hypothetical protein
MLELSWRDTILVVSPPIQCTVIACWYLLVANKIVPRMKSGIAVMLLCATTTAGSNVFNLYYVKQMLTERFPLVVLIALEEYGVFALFFVAFWRLSKFEPRLGSSGRDAWDTLSQSTPPKT